MNRSLIGSRRIVMASSFGLSILALVLVGLVPGFHSHADRGRALPQDAYIWQRHWTPALGEAIRDSSELVGAWRVLAAESDPSGHLRPIDVDMAELRDGGHPIVFVIRIDGQLVHWDKALMLAQIENLIRSWKQEAGSVAGVEIDHDCGIARLTDYAAFLREARARLGGETQLSITALPAWLSSPNLDAVLAATDQVVLQVHAVLNPRDGLFDPQLALRWAERLAGRTTKPFRLAVPAYGSRVNRRQDGSILSVESEIPRLSGGAATTELIASPEEVAAFVREIERQPLAHFAGITWFRLPSSDDNRAWSRSTWHTVLARASTDARVTSLVEPSETPGLSNLWLANQGDVDAHLPKIISLPKDCEAADGVNGYTIDYDGGSPTLRRQQAGLVPAGQRQLIGWMRCRAATEAISARP